VFCLRVLLLVLFLLRVLFLFRVQKVEETADDWLASRMGKKRTKQEMQTRKRGLERLVSEKEEAKNDLGEAVIQAGEEVQNVSERKASFESGQSFHEHRLESQDHAVTLTSAAEENLDKKEKAVKALKEELDTLNKKMLMGRVKLEHWCVKDLKRKACHMKWDELLFGFRKEAFDKGLRRPWEGTDGDVYEEWCTRQEMVELGIPLPKTDKDKDDEPDLFDDPDDEPDEFDWKRTDKMTRFDSEAYLRFLRETRPVELNNPWDPDSDVPPPPPKPLREDGGSDDDDDDDDDGAGDEEGGDDNEGEPGEGDQEEEESSAGS